MYRYPTCALDVNPVASVCVLLVPTKPALTSGSSEMVTLLDLNGLVLKPVYSQRFATRFTVVAAFCCDPVREKVCVILAAPGLPASPV